MIEAMDDFFLVVCWCVTGLIVWCGIRLLARVVNDQVEHWRRMKRIREFVRRNTLADDWYIKTSEVEDGE
jgi:hypothetical protein